MDISLTSLKTYFCNILKKNLLNAYITKCLLKHFEILTKMPNKFEIIIFFEIIFVDYSLKLIFFIENSIDFPSIP